MIFVSIASYRDKELIKTVSKISSGIKEFKGDPDLWYSLKDQLVSIKIC